MERDEKQHALLKRISNNFVPVMVAGIFIMGFLGTSLLAWVIWRAYRPNPLSFSQGVYVPTPSEACPGDTVEWDRTSYIRSATNAILVSSWIDMDTGSPLMERELGESNIFVRYTDPDLEEYYLNEYGLQIEADEYPLTITQHRTATVPENARYNSPVALVVTTLIGQPARYTVPVLVKSEKECSHEPK